MRAATMVACAESRMMGASADWLSRSRVGRPRLAWAAACSRPSPAITNTVASSPSAGTAASTMAPNALWSRASTGSSATSRR